ncbi:MAG: hypothetical protein GX539_10845 [Candidatus Cloacimonetes bacterium]|jgi:hypothetical protein|nr:hypothetical protein [Candidatus Cloacimonadota bacterium]
MITGTEVTAIRRISDDRTKWRVLVEAWPEEPGYRGRLVFAPDGLDAPLPAREGPAAFSGRTREDVLRQAWEMPEQQLRVMLHSLG